MRAHEDGRGRGRGRTRGTRRGVFTDLALGALVMGLGVGLAFPWSVVLLGVPSDVALGAPFRVVCLLAGLSVGGLSWLLARRLVGRPLRELADRLARTATVLHAATRSGDWTHFRPADVRFAMDGDDELTCAADAFDALLGALESERWFRSLVDASSDVVVLVDAEGRLGFASPSLTRVLGWRLEDLVGRRALALVDTAGRQALREVLSRSGSADGVVLVVGARAADGGRRDLELALGDHRADDDLQALVVTARDVTERLDLQRLLAHQASHDPLTGLPNRAALLERGARMVAALAPGGSLAVVMLDLDRFKEVNDTLGHTYGDRLLEQVGPRLGAALDDAHLLARLGGDEFALVLPGCDVRDARRVARRLGEALTTPFEVDGLALDIEASIGVAAGGPGSGIDALLRQADVAMYTAKERGSGVEHYDTASDRHSTSRLTLLSELRRGIAEGQLVLHYQPQHRVGDGRVVAVEALVRWQHPERGLLPPADFLPAAEPTGLIDTLTTTVLDLALAQARRWCDAGAAVPVAVNLSARSLGRAELVEEVLAALRAHGVPAPLLRLEITETALLTQPARAHQVLSALHEAGVGLSIDDFGTGYSSMAYLRDLPLDELKIDRGFVTAMASSPRDLALVRSSIALGHSMGLSVVAEGVETEDVATALQDLACDSVQGFLLGRPEPAAAVTAVLLAQRGGPAAVGAQPIEPTRSAGLAGRVCAASSSVAVSSSPPAPSQTSTPRTSSSSR